MLINLEGKPAHGCLALRQDLPIGLQNKVTNKNKSIIHQQYVNLPLVRRRYPEESTYTTIHLQSRFFRHTRKQNACLHTSSHRSTTHKTIVAAPETIALEMDENHNPLKVVSAPVSGGGRGGCSPVSAPAQVSSGIRVSLPAIPRRLTGAISISYRSCAAVLSQWTKRR
jgi:hypothetical protein